MIYGFGNVFFWTHSQTLNGHDAVVTFVEPLEQVIPPRGPSSDDTQVVPDPRLVVVSR